MQPETHNPMKNKTPTQTHRSCHYCNTPISGRADKKYCDVYCRVAFHRGLKKTKYHSLYQEVKAALDLNRRILMMFNFEGTTTVEASVLVDKGFNQEYFTHFYTNKKDESFRFVFETGFRTYTKNGRRYFELLKWRDHMDPLWELDNYFL